MKAPHSDSLGQFWIDLEPQFALEPTSGPTDARSDTTVRPSRLDAPPVGTHLRPRRPPEQEMLADLPRITFDPDKWTGLACIRGLPVSVATVLHCFATGRSIQEITVSHPGLGEEDVRQALEYAARQVEIPVIPPEDIALAEELKRQMRALNSKP
jgi:uncharacterized protein (DUF433 family)